MVSLALELNGMRVERKGEVRVSYPFPGIGVAFREVSPENHKQLQQMVRSLLPASYFSVAKAAAHGCYGDLVQTFPATHRQRRRRALGPS